MRSPRTVLRGVVVALVSALMLLLGLATPASAHDVLEGTTPKDGQSVAAAPDKVTLTFSSNPIAIGSAVLVKDASGTDWADGPVSIVDNVVTQKLKDGAPAGKYTVQWRVVSSDSHPIEGTFSYTVTSGGAAGASTAQPLDTKTAAPAQQAQGEPFPLMIVVFAVLAVILLVIVGVLARRRLGRDTED